MPIRKAKHHPAENWEGLPPFPPELTAEELAVHDVDPELAIDRASTRGMGVIREYAERCDRSEHFDTILSDLLADLRHACDGLGLNFYEADEQARSTYIGDHNP